MKVKRKERERERVRKEEEIVGPKITDEISRGKERERVS